MTTSIGPRGSVSQIVTRRGVERPEAPSGAAAHVPAAATLEQVPGIKKVLGALDTSASPGLSQPGRDAVGSSIQRRLVGKSELVRSIEDKLGAHVPGEILVRFKQGRTSLTSARALLRSVGARELRRLDFPGGAAKDAAASAQAPVVHVKLRGDVSTAQALALIKDLPDVAYAVPNHVYRLQSAESSGPVTQDQVPNDLNSQLWGMHNTGQDGGTNDADIDAPEAWQITTGSRNGPLIAILDTGADYNHPDLKNNIWTNPGEIAGDNVDNDGNGVVDDVHGYNPNAGTGNPLDGHSHGTHVAGTIGAEGNNGQGVVGVSWQARMLPIKIFSDAGATTADAIVKGINYATRMGARVTSNSWGGGPYNEAIKEAFAVSPALHVIAAGNESRNNDANPTYPASYNLDNIIAVAATTRRDALASFSNYGATSVDIGAPGESIYSTIPNGGYGSKSGTSMATPMVSGALGLLFSAFPNLSNAEAKARLLNGADRVSALQGKVLSGGRLNIANALDNDSVRPGDLSDLRVLSAGEGSLQLAWTATGDDGDRGQASAYIVKVSDRPIVDGPAGPGEVSFDAAQAVAANKPAAAGQAETLAIGVRPSAEARRLFVAIKAVDNVGNTSGMTSVSADIPAARGVVFQDSGDNADNWTAEGTWGRVAEDGRGNVWTDSPAGPYADDTSMALVSKPIDLSGVTSPRLFFEARHDLETRFDNLHVEVAEAGSPSWQLLATLTGTAPWGEKAIDLSAFAGKRVQVRFRITSDSSVSQDGVYIDNVMVHGEPVRA